MPTIAAKVYITIGRSNEQIHQLRLVVVTSDLVGLRGAATALSLLVMSAGLAYIVHEYCTQSHLSTESYSRAMQGLRYTRGFKKYTAVFRLVPEYGIKVGKLLWWRISGGRSRRGRRSLVWTADTQLYRLNNLESHYTRGR